MTNDEREFPATIHRLSQGSAAAAAAPVIAAPPRRWRTRVLVPGGLLAGAGALFLGVGAESLRAAVPVRVAPVVAKRVEGQAGATTVQASGWLEPAPFPAHVAALVPGVVAEVLVLEGDRVEPGQVVARLVDDHARLGARLAEAELAAASADLAGALARQGAVEASNALLIDQQRAASAQAARAAEALAALAELEATVAAQGKRVALLRDRHARTRRVALGGAASEGAATQQGLEAEAGEASLEALRRRRAVLEAALAAARAGERAAGQHLETLIDERRDAALASAGVQRAQAEVQRAEAHLAQARLALERHEVRALAPGVVMRLLVAPGARVSAEGDGPWASHVAHTYRPEHLQARVDVPLADAAKVHLDQQARVEVEALPDRSFAARVARVVHQADIQKNTVEFKVTLEEPDPQLKPDMLARVRFLAQAAQGPSAEERLFVPQGALAEARGGAATVWVAGRRRGARAIAERRTVELGEARIDGAVEVTAGLRPGDEVVVAPPPDLADGALLTVQGEAP